MSTIQIWNTGSHHCGQTLTIDHMLMECALLQEWRDEYYKVDSLSVLFETIPQTCIVEFLWEARFFYLIWCNLLPSTTPQAFTIWSAGVCIVTGMTWWILQSRLIECSLRDNSWDLHSRISARFFYLICCNLLPSTTPQTLTIWSDLSNYLENKSNSETHFLV